MLDRWIARQNIARFREQLKRIASADERRAIEKILAEEEAKLRAIDHGSTDSPA